MSDWRTRLGGLPDLGALRLPDHLRDGEVQDALRTIAEDRMAGWDDQLRDVVASGLPRAAWPPDYGQQRAYRFVTGSTVGPQYSGNSMQTLAEMSFSMTTSGGPVLVIGHAAVSTNQNPTQAADFQALIDGVAAWTRNVIPSGITQAQAGGNAWLAHVFGITVPTQGSHTYALQINPGAAATITAASTRRWLLALEL